MSITPVPGASQPAASFYGAGASPAARRPSTEAVATALGLDATELDRQLKAGATIADVAAAKGITPAQLIEAISNMMAPNADLNGDIPQRISLHKTVPAVHRPSRHRSGTDARWAGNAAAASTSAAASAAAARQPASAVALAGNAAATSGGAATASRNGAAAASRNGARAPGGTGTTAAATGATSGAAGSYGGHAPVRGLDAATGRVERAAAAVAAVTRHHGGQVSAQALSATARSGSVSSAFPTGSAGSSGTSAASGSAGSSGASAASAAGAVAPRRPPSLTQPPPAPAAPGPASPTGPPGPAGPTGPPGPAGPTGPAWLLTIDEVDQEGTGGSLNTYV